jgi:hypothetical protein
MKTKRARKTTESNDDKELCYFSAGNNGHTKTIIGCEDLTACLREIKRRGLTKEEK